ncbi:sigma54 specific transcriptional regulator, Fis family [Desulfotomaculum nigrificans CO-1-SRB]|uniref:HTH-type transcriptional regulatory protein TyrR n=1 Tax=Desulfotomaculum nigrificans (strain DSM 14880 / VKM B-2319 / CO-1-SRB) TaxID=868595 RepID=F6B5B0_DESCC|nr:sigma 54-interacting transcriptional regulator [Desulfotomaculum nigrificans]AEF94231.1 sigma54 specific transcriptional regulator, Fis family [Desulfotomaculum nigrificans CO-1-SRB]
MSFGQIQENTAEPQVFPVIAISPEMKKVLNLAKRVASYPTTVLISGETGVGKEVLASYIHRNSNRANYPFIKVNCGAIPESLLESELFGYEPGAFTGARREGAQGLLEAANHGSILFDEISELAPKAQAKLLRALQEREVRRVGGTWSKTVDVRVISSTNRNLREMVKKGLFREDLFYRLQVVHIEIPPLRKRIADIDGLLDYYVKHFSREFGLNKSLSKEVKEILRGYTWPGNVRELRNLLESLMVTVDKEVIDVTDLPRYTTNEPLATDIRPLKEVVDDAERQAIINALKSFSTQHAAEALGINYTTLMRKIQRLGIKTNKKNKFICM